jgi:hypothetical protein
MTAFVFCSLMGVIGYVMGYRNGVSCTKIRHDIAD